MRPCTPHPPPPTFSSPAGPLADGPTLGKSCSRSTASGCTTWLPFAGSAEDAEDLTQEIFLRLHQNLRLYRGDVPFAGWALRLSRNLCIDHYRRARRERRAALLSEEVLAQLPVGDDPQAEDQKRQQLRAVYRGLEEMSEELAEWWCCGTFRVGA